MKVIGVILAVVVSLASVGGVGVGVSESQAQERVAASAYGWHKIGP